MAERLAAGAARDKAAAGGGEKGGHRKRSFEGRSKDGARRPRPGGASAAAIASGHAIPADPADAGRMVQAVMVRTQRHGGGAIAEIAARVSPVTETQMGSSLAKDY